MRVWAISVMLSVLHLSLAFVIGIAIFYLKEPPAWLVAMSVIQLASGAIALMLVSTPMVLLALGSDSNVY